MVGVSHHDHAETVLQRFFPRHARGKLACHRARSAVGVDHGGCGGLPRDLRRSGTVNGPAVCLRQIHIHTHNAVAPHPAHVCDHKLFRYAVAVGRTETAAREYFGHEIHKRFLPAGDFC